MLILGIESSCDEPAAAVVAETGDAAKPWAIRSSIVASQVEIHREWGGVVPELASRQHVRDICGVVERALGDAGVSLGQLGAIAVTQGPGLVGSLLVGLSFAKSLAASTGLPLVPVHHLAGSCKMGNDELAVVDEKLRVRGIENLRIADASIMPEIVSGNTHAACVMIGEKAADLLLRN